MPGDLVRIHWRATPYKEKWVIARRGTEANPIVVQGVPGPGGERPVIDGRDATTRAALNFWNERRGVVKFGGANTPNEEVAAWIILEGLDVRSGRSPYSFTGRNGSDTYSDNAAAIYIEAGENIVIRDCVIRDSGNGLFIGASGGRTKNILVERNYVYDNGIDGSIYQHNSYTEAIDIVFEGNHYGPLRAGCLGNNLKDRSAGLVVRYNWIESGNRQLDLVDAEGNPELVNHPRYGETFVYGNILVEHEGDGNGQIIHYGGDSGSVSNYRKGTLYLYNNTIVSTRTGKTTLMSLSSPQESADVRNNIVYTTASPNQLALMTTRGTLNLRKNCIPTGWVDSHDSSAGTLVDDGSGVGAASPGFADRAASDYRLTATSPCRDQGIAQASGAAGNALSNQYISHQRVEPRMVDGSLDLGAFEYCAGTSCSTPDPDAGPGDAPDAGPGGTEDDAGPGGTNGDAGNGANGGDATGGCGCQSGGGLPGSAALLLLALAWTLRRRRETTLGDL